jgi:chemotaxis protein MotB
MSRDYDDEEEEQPQHRERWLVSYADFITLLFAFFTSLYAISVVDADKQERLVHSIQEAFGDRLFDVVDQSHGVLEDGTVTPYYLGDQLRPSAARSDLERLDALEDRARELDSQIEEEGISVGRTDEGLVISLADSFFFSAGGTRIPEEGRQLLAEVAELIKPLPNHIRVEGHTDDRPIATRATPSNWHLSVVRAAEVVRELERAGVDPARLSASGFGPHRPLVSNGSPDGRRINRRVDIVVLRARLSGGKSVRSHD